MLTIEAIVLAGGLGSRLQQVLSDLPKCMAPVHGRPFLTYVLDMLEARKINKVILSVGYLKNSIISYFGEKYNSLSITYSIEDEPLGTGGAIKKALNHCLNEDVFIVNGDTCFEPDFKAMTVLHRSSGADITLAVKFMDDTSRYGLVISDQAERIIEFREKDSQAGSGWINGGVYLAKKSVFNDFQNQKFSFENDLLKNSCKKMKMLAFQTDAFFLDIGIPEDYNKAQELLNAQKNHA